jgi:hypothetical protein
MVDEYPDISGITTARVNCPFAWTRCKNNNEMKEMTNCHSVAGSNEEDDGRGQGENSTTGREFPYRETKV